ncbi:aminotransferase class V-fold PLP-dependent enzyme [Enterococcus pallens]|uniref:Aminotransferase class V domain-containing protein n=1 Tax=Enterococcus pallens ATCC BAA-351 TaxID=1158607 RepID=R2PT88_9ENTE|nr:aminotransferase class V-fold PLP-dependent enzyme [Enterococcus pallens]EOH86503.1 hypothetical protein UAU_04943 [Enterococcus pallens ATCC BAA-351]EOU18299.1 hypothetical protein I588_03288 [Enterococcus pallens ATCC BAA-351]OJG81388.1 hypothetical protein RV10_GL003516 [Enterococcus pallens]
MDWQTTYRQQFPVAEQCIYLDNAYDCGGTAIARKAPEKYFDDWEYGAVRNERGGPGRATLFKTLDATRELLNQLVGGLGADQIAFTRNTNEGINAILQGFDFQPGDNIVTSRQEHPSVLMPCLNAARTRGVEARVIPAREDGQVLIEELTAAADDRTRMILVSHVQSATGYRIDLEKLGRWCHVRGIFLIVDAIQSLGLQPFLAQKWHVAAVAAASYKGLCGVNSTAFTYYHPELLKHIWPVYTAANSFIHIEEADGQYSLSCSEDTKAGKMENSSLDNLGIYVLHDALQEILAIGPDTIWQHIRTLYDQLHAGLVELGYEVVTPAKEAAHCGILSLKTDQLQWMFDYFRSKNVCLSISADQFIRFSLGAFNNQEDIDQLLAIAGDYELR